MKEVKSIEIKTDNQSVSLPVSKIVEIDTGLKTFVYFDKLNDGTFRLTFTKGLFETKE